MLDLTVICPVMRFEKDMFNINYCNIICLFKIAVYRCHNMVEICTLVYINCFSYWSEPE